MKPHSRSSAEILEQIEAFRAIAPPPGSPMPDDFAAQAQMLADKWHVEDLGQELSAARRLERAHARKPRTIVRRRTIPA